MRWVFENIQILFVIAGAIAVWLVKARRLQELRKEAKAELGREPTADEIAERTRRIQEEIRRKIVERQGGPAATEEEVENETLYPSPPVVRRTATSVPPPLPPTVVSIETAPGAAAMDRALAEQRRISEQLARLEARQKIADVAMAAAAGSSHGATEAAFAIAPAAAVAAGNRRTRLLDDLRERDSLRRAIVLREILGPAKWQQ